MAAKPILLDKPITYSQLASGEGFTFQANFEDLGSGASDDDDDYLPEISGQLNNVNLEDEDLYEYNQVEFEEIMPLMTPVGKEGKVMKRIFREGSGDLIPANSKVTYHYKAYLELEPMAFDSTYLRKRPEISNIHNVLYGLGIALQSMKVREKAQFLIQPEWAYGLQGAKPCVPPNSVILFEVEVINVVPIGDKDDNDVDLTESHDYATNFQKARRLCEEAKHLISVEKKEKPAIRNYNEAVKILCNISVKDEEQEKEYVTLLIRLYKNLAITYCRIERWEKACINCQEAYKLCSTFYRQVDTKVYYSHAKALVGLNELDRAEEQLRLAAKYGSYDRPNVDIMNLYKKIQELRAEEKKAKIALAQAMFNGKPAK